MDFGLFTYNQPTICVCGKGSGQKYQGDKDGMHLKTDMKRVDMEITQLYP
jgi:hypothetical protein